MTPYVAREALICEMSKVIRDFQTPEQAVAALLTAGYSHVQIMELSGEAVRRELLRRRLQRARAA